MRLDKLQIAGFKNLREFAVDFDEESPTTVLVGRNGTGKSNLLEALTIIFRDLDLGATPSFDYVLEYVCRGRKIKIEANPRDRAKATVDGAATSYKQLGQVDGERYLPKYVFGYYSGPSNRMEDHFEKHQERFYRDLLDGREQPLRPLFYARPIHSQFVLLAFFLKQDEETKKFLRENLWIEELDSVLFVMNEPPWRSKEGDERFWRARGTVSRFLDRLYGLSLAPLRLSQRVSAGFRKTTSREHLYLYLKGVEALRGLSAHYGTQQELFKALESTYISELIREVRIRVKARNVDGSLTFRELSEGEQQLLMVLGLLRFTKEDESLFLLDEPDTHLNPAWSLRYLEFLRQIAGTQENSHIIMATHDPLVIAGLTRSQVQIMRRDDETGQITAEYPANDPKGMGVAGLLTSEVYGLRSELDLETLGLLDEKRELAAKESLTEQERSRLSELDERLRGLDFTTTVRDPLYKQFVEAMAEREREEGLQAPVLTKEQQERQKELARQVLAGLSAKQQSEK
jgi:predicted ATPase